jgi:hypothetical protein
MSGMVQPAKKDGLWVKLVMVVSARMGMVGESESLTVARLREGCKGDEDWPIRIGRGGLSGQPWQWYRKSCEGNKYWPIEINRLVV